MGNLLNLFEGIRIQKFQYLNPSSVQSVVLHQIIFMPIMEVKDSIDVRCVPVFLVIKIDISKEAILKCPHCSKTLEKIKERKDFDVFKCKNNECPYYQKKLQWDVLKERKNSFKKDPQAFKMRYIYRQFHIDFQPLSKESPENPIVDLSRIYCHHIH